MKNWKKFVVLGLLTLTAGVFAFADGLNTAQLTSDASLLKKVVMYGVVPLIFLIITLKVFFLNRIIYFGLNGLRAYLAYLIIMGTVPSLPVLGTNVFLITGVGFAFFTAVITLYRIGANAVTDTIHYTGEMEWTLLENGSHTWREGVAGESAVMNFILSIFESVVYGVVMLVIMWFSSSRWGTNAPCYIVIALSAWNILKNIIGIIKHR